MTDVDESRPLVFNIKVRETTMKESFRDILLARLESESDRTAYSFIDDHGIVRPVSYVELLSRAVAIGNAIGEHARQGDRVMFMVSPGIDYVASFLACWIRGLISVPAYPLRKNQRASRIENVVIDAAPAVVLLNHPDDLFIQVASSSAVSPRLVFLSDIEQSPCRSDLDRYIANQMQWRDDYIVFLQYTSGSTGKPKGTMISHDNLMHNSEQMRRKFRTDAASIMVSWLPPYHDMGLILGVLQPLYTGFLCHLMTPATFMQRPLQWLHLISQTGATISGAPNFAYDLCVKRSSELSDAGLDLSTWKVAFNGAEPVMPDTLRCFADTFFQYGFKASALHPCYGLAENTLMVSGQDVLEEGAHNPECYIDAVQDGLAEGAACKEVVSSGTTIADQEVVVVDPVSHAICTEGRIGEIWVSGKSVAKGYWNNAAATNATFKARIAGQQDDKTYLRTGDLGQFIGGRLIIRSRLKDVINIRGRKIYPQDIERAVEAAHPQIRYGGYCAVFQSDEIQAGTVAVVAEIARQHRKQDNAAIAGTIRATVANEFGVRVSCVSLLRPGYFPKTSSGKIPRNVIKIQLLENELPVIGQHNEQVLEDL